MKSFVELGEIMLDATSDEACEKAYGTSDPYFVGRAALEYGDINADGTLN